MAITATDIKLIESEIMADTTDGGGRKTSRVIPDGVAGNIFPKVSRLDSVYGRVNLRKIYGAVQTATTDTYAGAHAVISDAPDNDRIHTTLFSTSSEFDTRVTARDRIESYVTSSSESRMIFVGRQLAGQQSILVYQQVTEPLVEIGDVLCLSDEPGGVIGNQQYVRVSDVSSEVRTFEDEKGRFERRIVTIDIGVPLRYTFNGPDAVDRMTSVKRESKVRTTTVVDAARYFGIKPLATAAALGTLDLKVSSVYSSIVPTTNRETPLSNVALNGSLILTDAKAGTVTESINTTMSVGSKIYTRRPMLPGSLTFGGILTGSIDQYDIDYENGVITKISGGSHSAIFTMTYIPAGVVTNTAHTWFEEIEIDNRGTVYTYTLNPLPAPGSVTLDFRALGKWYRLRDDSAGVLAGSDAAYGSGTVDYTTGAVVVTLGALPDVGSSILLGWGSSVHYTIKADATADISGQAKQRIQLVDLPAVANSVSVTYTSGGVQYTAEDDTFGAITGGGVTGWVNYTTGEIELTYTTRLPDAASAVTVSYQQNTPVAPGDEIVRSASIPAAGTMQLGSAVAPGTFNGSLPFSGDIPAGGNVAGHAIVKDNGAGLLVVEGGQRLSEGSAVTFTELSTIGTINYATGEIVVNTVVGTKYSVWSVGSSLWGVYTVNMSLASGTANLGWQDSGVAAASNAKTLTVPFSDAPLRLKMFSNFAGTMVPGSLMFTMGGKTYIDRNGSLYYDVSAATGAGTIGGTIDYAACTISLTYWVAGASPTISVVSCLATYGRYSATAVAFRTPGSPLRTGSFYVQATTVGGTLLSGVSNDNGVISGTNVSGKVDQDTGVVQIVFGAMVTAAGNEAEPWFNPANVVGGMVFKPAEILPSTLTYNAVVLANLPLNADILGLDPVRLPMDGRVPIYRNADVIVLHNTQTTTLTNPVVAGASYSAGRGDLAEAWLEDQTGTRIAADQYAVNLASGSVTMSADLALGSATQPLVLKHRIEDMNLVTDVQINGQLSLAAPLSRAYPAGTSFVSSALLFGDMNARVTNVFDLGTFSTWSDIAGTGATAQYNNIDFPIEVLNNGAVSERWRINFTSTTAFQVIGENLGVIATGSTSTDCSPTNQLTGQPYFVIRAAGWGSGWAAGNQLRFNTKSAAAPIWIARTVLPGATLNGDSFSMQLRGDVDA